MDAYKHGIYEYKEYEYVINNHKDEEAQMKINHSIYKRGWEMVESSHKYEKLNSGEIEYNETVAANETLKITFRYRVDISRTVKFE